MSEEHPQSGKKAPICDADPTRHVGRITPFCPAFHGAVELIGRRWTGAILRSMLAGSVRFSDIVATVPGLSDRLLSERLKELEQQGIVHREVFAETPVRVEYHLTEKGQALIEVIQSVSAWAERWNVPTPTKG